MNSPDREPTTAGTLQTHPGSKYTPDEIEFMRAVEQYQKRLGRKFLSSTDYLRVALSLGYRRTTTGEVRG